MLCISLGKIDFNLQWLDEGIHERIPAGRESHKERKVRFDKINEIKCIRELKDRPNFERQIATLGGRKSFH